MSRIRSIAVLLLLGSSALLYAQDDDVSLGDLARAARNAKASAQQNVIDNDNLKVVMDQAESERLNGKPVFSIDPSGTSFRMTSPDGTCSLSFDAKATALISTPYVASELPQDELLKLEGPATIHDGILEVSLHNGSQWELKEIVVGITVPQNSTSPLLKPALLGDPDNSPKLPDLTMLYHLKAAGLPDAITTFRGNLGGDLDSTKDWRWSLVSARGIPPAVPGSVAAAASEAASSSGASNDAGPSTTSSGSFTQPYPAADPSNSAPLPAPINAPPPSVAAQH